MKTVEVTRSKQAGVQKSTMQVAKEIFAKEGIRGMNKGVNAVALRQTTNWGSRFGLSRLGEDLIRNNRTNTDHAEPLTSLQKILASAFGYALLIRSDCSGALSCWNQPIEVIRVEIQSQIKQIGRPEKMTIKTAASWYSFSYYYLISLAPYLVMFLPIGLIRIYKNHGALGFYRGVTPRVCLGVWQTVCMVSKTYSVHHQKVFGGDHVKAYFAQ